MEKHSSPNRRAVDWDALNERLAKARESLRRDNVLWAERRHEVFDARARAMREAVNAPAAVPGQLELLAFSVANETYAIELASVGEVAPLAEYAFVPGAPAFVLGIMNLRGHILSIIDLRKFFLLGGESAAEGSKVIVLRNEQMEVGVVVDAALGVRVVMEQDLRPAASRKAHGRFSRGTTPDASEVLDGARLLSELALPAQTTDR